MNCQLRRHNSLAQLAACMLAQRGIKTPRFPIGSVKKPSSVLECKSWGAAGDAGLACFVAPELPYVVCCQRMPFPALLWPYPQACIIKV